MPLNVNLYASQGVTFRQSFIISNADGSTANLVGASAAMSIRTAYTAANPTLALSSPSNGIVVGSSSNPTPNYIDITVTATQTAAMQIISTNLNEYGQPYEEYVYDLLLTLPSGDVTKVAFGNFVVIGSVT